MASLERRLLPVESSGTLPVTEVDRVEVARGPFSSLYGGDAMGGVVNILTRPVDRRQIEVEEQYGTYNAVEYTLRYSERFWKKLGVAASYQRQQYGGYSTNDVFASATAVSSATGSLIPSPCSCRHDRRIALRGGPAGQQLVQPARFSRQDRLHLLAPDDGFVAVTLSPLRLRLRQRDFADSRCQRQPAQTGTFFFNDGTLRRFSLTPGGFLSAPAKASRKWPTCRCSIPFRRRNIFICLAVCRTFRTITT